MTDLTEIFIPIPMIKGHHVVLTAYTSLAQSKLVCQRYAEELGYAGKLKWRKDAKGAWIAQAHGGLRFAIAHRILNGIED